MADPAAPARADRRLGTAGALGAIAIITLVTLVTMVIVLTNDTGQDTGRRTSNNGEARRDDAADAATTSTTSTTTVKPGIVRPLPDLDDASGWSTDVPSSNGVTCSGPSLQGNVAAVLCDDRHMFGFDTETGEQLWDTKVDDDKQTFIGPPTPSGSHSFVYARADVVTSVDATTGEIAWRVQRDGVLLGLAATDRHVFTLAGGRGIALDPETGALQWETPFREDVFTQGGPRVDSSATDFVVNLGTGFQDLDADTGEIKWTATLAVSNVVALRVAPDAIYLMESIGHVMAIDVSNGSVRWERKGEFDHNLQTIGGWDDNALYLASTSELGALSRKDGSTIWSFTSGEALQQPEGIDRVGYEAGHLITRSQGQVFEIDPKTGKATGTKLLNTATPGRVRNNQLYILQATFAPTSAWRLVTLGLGPTSP